MTYTDHNVERRPIGGAEAIEIARRFRTLYVKIGGDMVKWGRDLTTIPEADLRRAFVHEDGQLKIPVLIIGDAIVRGFDEPTYVMLLIQ